MKYPLISVVIPAHNEEKYLPNVLSRLKNQNYPKYEIIVVDNASHDKTAAIAGKYTDKVIFEGKMGMSHARHRGFLEAKGEIIARTDADSLPVNNWLMQIYENFQKNPEAAAIFGDSQFYDIGRLKRILSKYVILATVYFTRLIMGHYQLNGPNYAVKRDALRKTKPHFDDKIVHEDIDLSCHISSYGKVVFIHSMTMDVSGRRFVRNPLYIFEYAYRIMRTYFLHHPSHKLHKVR